MPGVKKCYTALHDKQTPCTFCPLSMIKNIEKPQELTFSNGKSYEIRAKELEWNGLPAYTLFINDITDKITSSRKTEQLEQFYQTLVQNLPAALQSSVLIWQKNKCSPNIFPRVSPP